jgi:hypothetical protein
MNLWCGLADDQAIMPLILEVRLTTRYLHFSQDELPLSPEDVPLQVR